MTPDDFFQDLSDDLTAVLSEDRLAQLRNGPLPDSAQALADLVHREYEAFGTDGSQTLTDAQSNLVLRVLKAVLRRLDIEFEVPWRNFSTFRSYWIQRDCAYSWQARRDLLLEYFEPVHRRFDELEDQLFQGELADPISPHPVTEWPKVDAEIRELRRRFHSATTPQDYRAIGTHCVGVLEALSRTVYDPAKHLRDGEEKPPVDRTKERLGRYIEVTLAGKDHENLRGVAVKTIALAHQVKHRETPSRREAGIVADVVILVANILRRLEESIQ